MAKRGDAARADVMDTITKAFKDIDAFEGIVDKKIYVWAQDGVGGEKIQFAISITAPKTPVTCGGTVSGNEAPWESAPQTSGAASSTPNVPIELSAADKQKVASLMASLGLN